MLPTLAERLREQRAKSRGRSSPRQPWPVPGDPPTALLFLSSAEAAGEQEAAPPATAEHESEPVVPVCTVTITPISMPGFPEPVLSEPEIPEQELSGPEPVEPPTAPPQPDPAHPAKEKSLAAELLLLLVWAVLVVADGALALASLIDRRAGRRRPPPSIALPSSSAWFIPA